MNLVVPASAMKSAIGFEVIGSLEAVFLSCLA